MILRFLTSFLTPFAGLAAGFVVGFSVAVLPSIDFGAAAFFLVLLRDRILRRLRAASFASSSAFLI